MKSVVAAVLVGVVLLSGCKKPPPEDTPAEKKAKAAAAALLVKLTTIPTKEVLAKKPVLKGKAIYFEYNGLEWSKPNSFYGSSTGYAKISDRLTYAPEKAGTVILKPSCTSSRSGNYGGVPAYVQRCDLVLIDPVLNAVVYRARLEGQQSDSATLKKSTTRVDADVSSEQIYEFIGGLPQT